MDQNLITPLSFFFQGAALGLAAAATPGAFQAYLITQSILHGFRSGGVIAFAPLISDPPVVLIVLLALSRFPQSFLKWIGLAGGLFVIYLAVGIYKRWRSPGEIVRNKPQTSKVNLLYGALLNILSPGLYLYWTLVNGPLLISALQKSLYYGIVFLIGFYGFFITGMLIIAALFAQTRRLGEKFIKGLLLVSAITLTAFGIVLIWRSL